MTPTTSSFAGFRDAVDLRAALRSGRTTSRAVIEQLLERSAEQADLVAISHIDTTRLLSDADAADARRAQGSDLPLLGLPICVKDNINTVGFPTTAGSPALADAVASENAPVLQRLLDQGAIVFGKTHMHELAYGTSGNNAWSGATRNPFDTSRIPGGSSSGTAAAIAAGIVPFGLGSDTGGSVRIPAAFCGLAGLRPTSGRYPGKGVFPISPTRDTVGPLGRSFADIALLDDAICLGSKPLTPADVSALRLGVPDAYFFDGLEADVRRVSEEALDLLGEAGVTLVAVPGAAFGERYRRSGFSVTLFETRAAMDAFIRENNLSVTFDDIVEGIASPDVRDIMADIVGREYEPFAKAYRQAMDIDRPWLQAHYAEILSTYRLDGIVFPTTKLPALEIDQETIDLGSGPVPPFDIMIENTGPGSLCGVPGISVPCGMTRGGVPLGLSIDGAFWSDRLLLDIGAALEQILPNPWIV